MKQFDDFTPFGYPHKDDLITFGGDGNGNDYYWLINKTDKHFSIVINEFRTFDWQQFDMTVTDFLFKSLTKQINVEAWPDDFPTNEHRFESWYEGKYSDEWT